jgi:4-carboxymuconolactone decarboxylase
VTDTTDISSLGSGERWDRGWRTLTEASGTDSPAVVRRVAEVAPELARWIVEFGYGDAYSRPGLTRDTRQLVTIGALSALGGCEDQLEVHVALALRVGNSPEQIIETIMHVLPYVGFPRALNALEATRRVLDRKGIVVTVD